ASPPPATLTSFWAKLEPRDWTPGMPPCNWYCWGEIGDHGWSSCLSTTTSRSGCAYGGGCRRTASTSANTATQAPTPSASVAIASDANAGRRSAPRQLCRISETSAVIALSGPGSFVAQRLERRDVLGAARRHPAREERGQREHTDDRRETRGIDARDAEQLAFQDLAERERASDADRERKADEPPRVTEHEATDARGIRADRHAHAELAAALGDRERQHAVDADRGQQQGERREHAEQLHRHASAGQRQVDALVEGLDVEQRLARVDRTHGRAQRFDEGGRRHRGTQHEQRGAARRLAEVEVVRFLGDVLGEIAGLDRTDHADDRVQVAVAVTRVDALAERIAVREVLALEQRIDDRDLFLRIPVRGAKRASAQQRDMQAFEVAFVDRLHAPVRRHAVGRSAIDAEPREAAAGPERQRIGDRDAGNASQAARSFDQAFESTRP